MLSAQLLRILRVYWRLATPQGYLFPGRDPNRPIDVQVLYSACRSARAAAGCRYPPNTTGHSPILHSWRDVCRKPALEALILPSIDALGKLV